MNTTGVVVTVLLAGTAAYLIYRKVSAVTAGGGTDNRADGSESMRDKGIYDTRRTSSCDMDAAGPLTAGSRLRAFQPSGPRPMGIKPKQIVVIEGKEYTKKGGSNAWQPV